MWEKINVLLFIVALALVGVISLIFPNRSEVSAIENRTLAKFPEFNQQTLQSGNYFLGLENYYSDHFLRRDNLVSLSAKLSALRGIKGEDEVEVITVDSGDQFANYDATKNQSVKKNEDSKSNESESPIPDKQVPKKESVAEREVTKKPENKDVLDSKEGTDNLSGKQMKKPIQSLKPETKIEDTLVDSGKIQNSFLVVGDSVYEIFGSTKAASQLYADAVNGFANKMPEKTRVLSLLAPSHIEFIQNEKYRNMSGSQKEAIDRINGYFDERIKPIDARGSILPHYKEYLYFRSDHHWTARGAYYAYEAFCQTTGVSPITLDRYERVEVPGFLGSLYRKTQSAKVKANPDMIEVFKPIVKSDFKIHTRKGSVLDWNVINMNYAKPKFDNKYLVFLSGDEPLSIITTNVATTKKILVFKDSYGNAFIPFLMSHYKEIHIIDPRHYKKNAVEYALSEDFDDILFLNYIVVVGGNHNFAKNIQRVSQ